MSFDYGTFLNQDLLLTAINKTGVGVVISNPNLEDNPLIFVNEGFEKETGYSRNEVLGKNCRFLQGPKTDPLTLSRIREAIENKQPVQVEILNYRKNGETFWNELTISPIFDNNGCLAFFTGIQKNITARKTAEDNMKIYKSVLDHTLQGVIITDQHGKIIFVNDAFIGTTGYSFIEVVGKSPNILSSGKHEGEFYHKMWTTLLETGQWKGEIWNKRKNGEIYVEFLNISALRDQSGNVTNFVAIFSDITDQKLGEEKLKSLNKKLEELSSRDALTSIFNRRSFDQFLGEKWKELSGTGSPISLILFDIDFFKKYNDTYGHLQGDQCLRMVVQTLTECVELEHQHIARYGGEEFAVVLPGQTNEDAIQMAETIRRNIENKNIPHKTSEISDRVTISVGVASVFPDEKTTFENLIYCADTALYLAKEKGKNRVEAYEL